MVIGSVHENHSSSVMGYLERFVIRFSRKRPTWTFSKIRLKIGASHFCDQLFSDFFLFHDLLQFSDQRKVRKMNHRHQCLIYDGAPSRVIEKIARLIIEKLNANKRCLYLNSPIMVAGLRCSLAASGLDLAHQIEKGALVLSSDTSHLVDGVFDVNKMMAFLKSTLQQTLSDGYTGFWASGDMTWEFGNESNLSKLYEYECRLEEFLQSNPAMDGICQYHRDTLPAHAVLTALDTHKSVYVNETLMHLNPFFRTY
jgi:hypothetical protein